MKWLASRWRDPRSREALLGYLLVAPLALWLAATLLYPLFSAVYFSFQDVGIIGTAGKFIGLDNYATILRSNQFWDALLRSLIWVVSNGLLQTILAFAAALILRQRFPGHRFSRVWIILSWIVPTVVVVIIWRWMLGTSGGVVNYLLVALGIVPAPIGFFGHANSAFASLAVVNSWRWFPLMAVILLAGMQNIPAERYEAAAVDGAAPWQRFRHVTLPGLRAVLYVMGLVGTLWSVNVFDVIWLMTGGGPSRGTTTLPVFIYDMGFKQYRLSQAAAASVILGLLLLVFAVLFIRFMAPPEE